MQLTSIMGWSTSAILSAALMGCGAQGPDPLTPKDFVSPAPQHTVSETPLSRTDAPGELARKEPNSAPEQTPAVVPAPIDGIPRAVQNVILPPGADLATTQPTTMPTTEASATTESSLTSEGNPTTRMSPGTWIVMGSLVAEVNGAPIYANKVLRLDGLILKEKARQYNLDQFEIAARQIIEQTVNELIHDELEYAAAEKTLSTQDKQLADGLTQKWREQQISESGGSPELAKRKFAADGKDFEDAVKERHRFFMVQLYYTRKINPQVQVSRTDIYRYYVDHQDPDFTTHDAATIDIVRAQSQAVLDDFRKQLLAGGDFGDLSKMTGIDYSKRQFPLVRGSFALKKVDAAVWNLQVGDTSQPIEDHGGFYLVKVDSRVAGVVQPFESETVQNHIKDALQNQQLRKLRDDEQRKLMEGAIVTTPMIDTCVEMAMENYTYWRTAK